MARDLSAAFLAAIAAGTVRWALFYEGEFNSGTLRLWSGLGDMSWNGYTWTGAGNLLAITPVEETSEIRAVSFEVALNGMSQAQIELALAQCRSGLSGTVWLGLLDSAGAVIADPFASFIGRLDVPDIADDGTSAKISIRYESRLIDLDRVRERRYTAEDQAIDDATDRGFEFVPMLQDALVMWVHANVQG